MKAQKGNSLSARCVGVCLFKRTYASVRNTNHEVGAAILKKRERKWTKQDEIRRKVHLFLWNEIEFPLFATFSFRKSRNFETKILLLCLIKHNIPFSTAWRRLYSANWGTFSCELAQMIFGLLKKTILCSGKYRDWCLKALFFRRLRCIERRRA